jgi:protein-S-isoprenylcysteine O-methyltransferase Ste14
MQRRDLDPRGCDPVGAHSTAHYNSTSRSRAASSAWAALTLGRFYTRTLLATPDQVVVRTGPYRFVRHPGYLGTLLMWFGFGLSSRDWLIALLYGGVMRLMYERRIRTEESMLARQLGEAYVEYMRTTPGLVPRPARRVGW